MQFNTIYHLVQHFFLDMGMNVGFSDFFTSALLLLMLIGLLMGIDYIINKILIFVVETAVKKSPKRIDNLLVEHKALDYFIHFIPLIIAKKAIPVVFIGFPNFLNFCNTVIDVLIIIVVVVFLNSVVKASLALAKTMKRYNGRPIDGFFQVISIVLYVIGTLVIIGRIFQTNPVQILTAIGATSAVVLLVFKDTIMGLVASIQITSNDMIRVGDWIEMNKFGADGTVIQINLNTVKVENFDKTITTIPTHFLITDSFKNYRHMFASGGRRIKRSVQIKMNSVRFLSDKELEELRSIIFIKKYIEKKQAQVAQRRLQNKNSPHPVNNQPITNLALFREYFVQYVRHNNNINKNYFLMVRQLQSSQYGIPLELYAFSSNTAFSQYEDIASDIFDHILSVVPYFHLEIFELCSENNAIDG